MYLYWKIQKQGLFDGLTLSNYDEIHISLLLLWLGWGWLGHRLFLFYYLEDCWTQFDTWICFFTLSNDIRYFMSCSFLVYKRMQLS